MDPRQLPCDERYDVCAYCSGEPATADHVPSKILLDEPYPEDLPVVRACRDCNSSFSRDEQYVACFLECVLSGSSRLDSIDRAKVRSALEHSPALATMIEAARKDGPDGPVWLPDHERVRRIVLKLARGHVAFELSAPRHDEPESVWARPLITMTEDERADFEGVAPSGLVGWPEIGSRAFMNAVEGSPQSALYRWLTVQQGRYRYALPSETAVRMVIGEYLACEVLFD